MIKCEKYFDICKQKALFSSSLHNNHHTSLTLDVGLCVIQVMLVGGCVPLDEPDQPRVDVWLRPETHAWGLESKGLFYLLINYFVQSEYYHST